MKHFSLDWWYAFFCTVRQIAKAKQERERTGCGACWDKGWYATNFAPSGIPDDWAYCHCQAGQAAQRLGSSPLEGRSA